MPPRPQRLVRRRPLGERLRAMLNPIDFYLWLSEEIQTFDWDSKEFGTRFGLVANFVFLVARANNGGTSEAFDDDVFGDSSGNGLISLVVNFLLWTLASTSLLNAFYTMTRSRSYRLFEVSVETAGPGTPSAQRVRVDSSPASSTPLRLIQGALRPETAEQRAHPDKTRDVWEMRVWDPYPATLRMFCLFSPGHVLIHMLFLPLPPLDPRPSVTVFKCILLQVILSAQLLLMHSRFSQQSKDTAIIQKEVMHEYDVKYVHPRLHPVVREVSTQVSINDGKIDQEEVTLGTPATIIRRAFQTHPNPNYAKHIDPNAGQMRQPRGTMSPSQQFTPSYKTSAAGPTSFAAMVQQHNQSPLRRSLPPMVSPGGGDAATTDLSKTSFSSTGTSTGTGSFNLPPGSGFGGSLGVYTHMNSPLKKTTSLGDMKNGVPFSPRNSREMAALEQRELAERMVRQSSPFKESNRRATTQLDPSSFLHSPEKLAKARATRWTQERFPSRRV